MALNLVIPGQFTAPDTWRYIVDPTSIADLDTFRAITVDSGGLDPQEGEARIVLRLEGAGGSLNLSLRIGGDLSVQIEDIGLTSGVVLKATFNNDVVNGSAFADMLYGLAGNDTLNGGEGNDSLVGGTGTDAMAGGDGDDVYYVDNAFDTVAEAVGKGSDKVFTSVDYTLGAGQEIEFLRVRGTTDGVALTGNERNDYLVGGEGGDTLNGADGDDTLVGGAGIDAMAGGEGDDVYYVDNAFDTVAEAVGKGSDKIFASADYMLGAGQEIELLRVRGTTDGLTLTGNELGNFLVGGAGEDTLSGLGGDDRLNGGEGEDWLAGGTGNDTYYADNIFDTVIEDAGGGTDRVYTNTSYELAAGSEVEILRVWDTIDGVNLLGNEFTNRLTGGAGNDHLDGATGADRLNGGAGNDTIVGAVNDTLLDGGADDDTLQVGTNFTSTGDGQIANIEQILMTSALTTLNLSNQTEAFTITGSSDRDRIISGSGDDTIICAPGGESLSQSDILDGGGGYDTLELGTSYEADGDAGFANIELVILTAAVEVYLFAQAEAITVIGSFGDDTITTSLGAITINAGDGNDTLITSGVNPASLMDGGDGTDKLRVYGTFAGSSDGQLVNIEEVIVTGGGGTADLSNQTEAFRISTSYHAATLIGGSGADTIVGFFFNDTIYGAQNDILLDGGDYFDSDTLVVGANFTSTSDDQIVRIERVAMTAAGTLDLSNQSEAFIIFGSSGNDIIRGGNQSTMNYASAGAAVTVSLVLAGVAQDTVGAGIDTLSDFVDLTGSAFNDTLTGDSQDNIIEGGAGSDTIDGDAGNDVIVGAQNDTLLDGGAGTGDQLRVGANFASTSDGQIVNMDGVLLTAAVTLNLAHQTESFVIVGSGGADTITGGSGADAISSGAGNDVIAGAANDTLLDGGANTDILWLGSAFTSTSDAQMIGIEQVLLTSAVTLSLVNQTESFAITGSSGNDTIRGGSGNDTVNGGDGNDMFFSGAGADSLTGGAGSDSFFFEFTGGGSFATIADFTPGADLLDFRGVSGGSTLAQLFANGNLSFAENGTDTVISYDIDGAAGATYTLQTAFVLTGTGLGLTPTDFIV